MLANLKPYPEVKHSGVEWLGEVPTHWEVRRLASIGTFSKGKGGSKDDEVDAGVPCIRYGDLYTTHLHTVVADEACTTVVLTPAAMRLLEEDDTHLAVELYRYIIGAQAQSFDPTQALDKRETK